VELAIRLKVSPIVESECLEYRIGAKKISYKLPEHTGSRDECEHDVFTLVWTHPTEDSHERVSGIT
jgi:hypothetical protein